DFGLSTRKFEVFFNAFLRLYGFAICLSSGLACTILSMLVFFNPIKFGITFTFGNLLALGRSAPSSQKVTVLDPMILYSLSYIPFARSAVSKVMVSCFDTEF
ncbi:hypothetical protein BHE74_00051282, partial [Ensete ventricosum]